MRSLGVAVLLCAAFTARARADGQAGQYSGVTGAALEALRGHPKQARAMLTSGKGDPADPAALVVLASMALDEGNTREAVRLIARLRAAAPGAPEARLLDALAKERVARPRNDWFSAGLNAVEAVQPLVASGALVPMTEEQVLMEQLNGRPLPFPDDAAARLSVPDRFLARWAWAQPPGKNQVLIGEALRLAFSDERPLVFVAALDVLSSAEPPAAEGERQADIAAARRAAREKLRGTPAERLRFLGLPPRTEAQPVDEEEVAAIEAMAAGDDPPSFASNYTDLLRILEKLDPAMGPWFAQSAAIRLTWPPTSLVAIVDRAARASLTDEARERLATAFMRLADRELREGLVITDLFAAVYLGNAAALRRDPVLKARAEAVRPETEALRDTARCLEPLLRLPIRSIHRAWAEHWPHEREIIQQVGRRGLSCPEPKPQPKNVEERPSAGLSAPCPDPAAAVTR